MTKKPKPKGNPGDSDLWINPRSNLKGPEGSRAWGNKGNISPETGARFLEMADIALGLKKPSAKKKKAAAAGADTHLHQTEQKTEPYKS